MKNLLSFALAVSLLSSSAIADPSGATYRTTGGATISGSAILTPTTGTDPYGNPIYGPPTTTTPIPVGGVVGSFGDRAVSTPTVQNAAYSSGNCVGGFNSVTFQGTGPINLLNDIRVTSQGGGTETLTVYVFDQNPSGSTCTDKSTFTLATADTAKLLLVPFALTLVVPTGVTQSFASNPNLARIPKSGSTTLWYGLVAGGTFTPGSATDLMVSFQVVQQHQ